MGSKSRPVVAHVAWCLAIEWVAAGCTRIDPEPVSAPVEEASQESVESAFRFVDVSADAGLTRMVWSGRPDKDHLLDSAGTGVAFLDYDRDGRLDAYIVNAWRVEGTQVVERGRHTLYHGRPDGTFEDVTDVAGVAGEGHWGSGVCVADQNGDGWPDILVTHFGPNILYRNRGDGTFTNVAARVGVEAPGWNTGAAFFDADGDRDLDLYVARYIDCSLEDVLGAKRTLDWKGLEQVAFGPFGLEGAKDVFFRADGSERFTDATQAAGLEDKALGFGFTVRALDFDVDGDLDLYVANDSDANYLYRNEGNGSFAEVAIWSGLAFDTAGAAQASMGITVGDTTGDGLFEIFVTHFAEDKSTFYQALGDGIFEDKTDQVGLGGPLFLPLSWGTALADLDNDGDLDLVVANGHIYPQVDAHPETGITYAQRNLIFENQGGVFVDVTSQAGAGFEARRSSRGLAVGDYDNDGDLDLLFSHLDAPPTLLRNESRCGSWLSVECEVAPGKGSVIGTRVEVMTGGKKLVRDVASSDSYLSAHDQRLHFGLGSASEVERLEVLWPDGGRSTYEQIPARQFLKVHR